MLKDIQVHLDGSPLDEVRLGHGALLAREFEAHLTGLFTNPLPEYTYVTDASDTAVAIIAQMREEARTEGDAIETRLNVRLRAFDVPSEIRRFDAVLSELEVRMPQEARWGDIFVACRPYGSDRASAWRQVIEAVLFGSGRAIYLVPETLGAGKLPRQPFVCWSNSREAARALSEALPFLKSAGQAVLAIADPDTGSGASWREPAADVARHLHRHGIKTEVAEIALGRHTPAEALLHEAHQRQSDLVVLGGYGHSRLREWALGGVTRDMLLSADMPLLLAH